MSMIIVNRVNDIITGSVNGVSFSVQYSEENKEKYQAMLALEAKAAKAQTMEKLQAIVKEFTPLTHESYKEIVESASPYIHVNKATNQFFLKWNNTMIAKVPLPTAFAERLIQSVEKGIEILPLLKAWVRFQRPYPGKPAFSLERAENFAFYISAPYTDTAKVHRLQEEQGLSKDKAVELSTTPQVAITKEGLLVCYKVSKEILHRYDLNENEEVVTKSRYKKSVDPDTGSITYEEPEHSEDFLFEPVVMGQGGDEFWCTGNNINKKGHHIRVGCLHHLDNWSQVSSPGNKGLHCGGLSYIEGYQTEGTVTHNVFVDPADIHSVNTTGDGALTCKKYFVYSSFKGVNKNIYHSSTYAAMNDTEFQLELEKIVKAAKESHEENLDNLHILAVPE